MSRTVPPRAPGGSAIRTGTSRTTSKARPGRPALRPHRKPQTRHSLFGNVLSYSDTRGRNLFCSLFFSCTGPGLVEHWGTGECVGWSPLGTGDQPSGTHLRRESIWHVRGAKRTPLTRPHITPLCCPNGMEVTCRRVEELNLQMPVEPRAPLISQQSQQRISASDCVIQKAGRLQ